jgi:hypothetical protein
MAEKDIVIMSQEELKRISVIHKAIDKQFTQAEAAGVLGLTDRQIRRIIERVSREGDKGIIHRSRGRPSHNATPDSIKRKVINLCKEKYSGFGPTLASEKLFEINKTCISRETLRQWLKRENLPYRDRKKRPHRQWRERKHHFGQMTQMDGSHHDWFEGRGPECVFMAHIDDATGNPFGRFYSYEGTIPAMDCLKRYIKRYGMPLSIYLDKHTTYKSNGKPSIEDELNNVTPLSQFERVCEELGIQVIHANSPQAKGRIERLFNTFQDRLIKEMRLRKISSIDKANKFLEYYLPVYAKRFNVQPARDNDLHRPCPKSIELDKILCVRTERTLRNDFTIAHNGKLYQILDNLRAERITVEENVNGSTRLRHKDATLRFKIITTRPKKEPVKKAYEFKPRTVSQLYDHPWRVEGRTHYQQYQQKEKAAQAEKELLLTTT